MPQGDKSSYKQKQKRTAHKMERSVRKRGGSRKTAERIGWATVNKRTGGAKKKRSAAGRRRTAKRPVASGARKKGRGRGGTTKRSR